MLAIVVPPDLGAKKLREAVTLRRDICARGRERFALARRPQRGDMREFVVCAQKENPGLPQRHRGTERETPDEHG